ncbi:MAG: hypothetical protein JOY90_02840 [Bradyrhizobium sp.]|uniref:hypothetical protein n=1 Tax=Bradyrhizobium sp. TaxID=376 RepID=UPI001D6D50FF|nr:hypothetical protein [Bradyrhizobium sp.]MBV9559389.1 hypothetical protein [Bradyrhizobium sp.]
MNRNAKDAPRRGSEIPGRGITAVEARACDVDRLLRAPGDSRQLLSGAPGNAVIVSAEIGAVEAEAMDEAGLAIGNEQRL